MSSKPKRNESTGPQSISTPAAEAGQASTGNTTHEEEIRRRAYEIYLERGEQPCRELGDLAPSRTRTRRSGACAGGLGS